MDTMLPFSGGCDSTLCLYNYLKNNPGKKLLVYHVNLKNWEGRQDLEHEAVHNILDWLRARGFVDFEYLEMTFDYGTAKRILWDAELWGFFDGLVLRDRARRNAIQNIICPYIKTEHQAVMLSGRHQQRMKLTDVLTTGKKLNYLMPILNMDKAQIVNALPRELYDLVWYCRRPVNGKPCHKCFTCRAVDKVKINGLAAD